MASKGHDKIVEMIQYKMRLMGFKVVATDGCIDSKLPPTIISHRPDCIGLRESDKSVCIGEAKYYGDLHANRSKRQICDFAKLSDVKSNIYFILGLPKSEISKLRKIIDMDYFRSLKRIIILEVPDNLCE